MAISKPATRRKPAIITHEELRRLEWLGMVEAELEQFESDLAKAHGWLRYHTHNSEHSPSGFPDDVLVRGPDLIFLENKREHERYQPTEAQVAWHGALRQVRNIQVEVVKPHDMDRIATMLERGL